MTSRIPHLRPLATGTAAALLAITLAACSDSTSGTGSQAGTGGSSGGGSSSAGSTGSSSTGSTGSSGSAVAPATTITDLAKTLVTSTAQATTVHLSLATSGGSAADAAGSGEGDVRTGAGGRTEAFSFDIGSGATSISMVFVDGAGYVKLPASEQTDPTKPWAKVSKTSTNPVVKAISASFDQIDTQTSLTQYAALVKSATNFRSTGRTDVDGTPAQGYSFSVDPKNLPNAKQLGSAIAAIGPIPTTMAIDDQGRPVQVVEKISVAGQSITTTVTFSNYGKDVDIAAPPASQTSTG